MLVVFLLGLLSCITASEVGISQKKKHLFTHQKVHKIVGEEEFFYVEALMLKHIMTFPTFPHIFY